MDAFYASVEMRESPGLRGLPVAVGGSGGRGVVASASYEARAFGVASAMPVGRAKRLCPGLVVVPPRFDLYHADSKRLHDILRRFAPVVEGIGLDEAFLDITGCAALFGSPLQLANALRKLVARDLGLFCSVGAGPNKLVAKLASKAAKPKASRGGPRPGAGVVIVEPGDVLGFISPLPVEALWGVGPASAGRLHKLGITTVGELAMLPESALVALFGKAGGRTLRALARGEDERPVVADNTPKSIGHEETFPIDITDRQELARRLVVMADSVAGRVRHHGMVARTVTIKIRYSDFTTVTRSHTFPSPQSTGPAFWGAARGLLDSVELREGLRLLGLSASGLLRAEASPGEQLDLLSAPVHHVDGGRQVGGWDRASRAVDAVRARFGHDAVGPGVTATERRPGS